MVLQTSSERHGLRDGASTVVESLEARTLVVIDMQFDFPCSLDILRNVERLILAAKARGWNIVILEFGPPARQTHTPTYSVLTDHLHDYPRVKVMKKWDDTGAPEVQLACEQAGFSTKSFVLCGVNTSGCVRATAFGMSGRFPNSEICVAEDACNDDAVGQNYDWSNFYQSDNVSHATMDSILAAT